MLHVSGDDVVPPFQIDPASIAQLELHPSPLVVFPSSQVSEPARLLSPQWASQVVFPVFGYNPALQKLHVSIVDVVPPFQIAPASIAHDELHPSPFVVFPSSHPSDPALKPSPHTVIHDVFVASGVNPPVQNVHTSIVVGLPPVQIAFVSMVQLAVHPSLLLVFPSSHFSLPALRLSPHNGTHDDLVLSGYIELLLSK